MSLEEFHSLEIPLLCSLQVAYVGLNKAIKEQIRSEHL